MFIFKGPVLRLGNETQKNNMGRIEITVDNKAGAVCADNWDDDDATTACYQLNKNFTSGVAVTYMIFLSLININKRINILDNIFLDLV